jgi:FKBP-type peptidyl-prolyl cis-trans isomerase FkpA
MWLGVVMVCALAVSGCSGSNSSPTAPSANVPFSTTDIRTGTGPAAATGRLVGVRYTGWLYSATGVDNKGTQFDSGAFAFTVGSGVISGFSQGVIGMQVGGLRRVVIPPNLGYGAAGSPPAIPGNSTLIFEIELLSLQ